MTGTKYLWLYAEENRPEAYQERWAALQRLHLKTGRAWAIKESLRHLWVYHRRGWAERYWRRWYFWATHSRLPAVIKVAGMLKRHLPNVLNYFDQRITNAMSEGMNSKIEGIKKTPAVIGIGGISRLRSTFIVAVSISIPASRDDQNVNRSSLFSPTEIPDARMFSRLPFLSWFAKPVPSWAGKP